MTTSITIKIWHQDPVLYCHMDGAVLPATFRVLSHAIKPNTTLGKIPSCMPK